MKFAVGRLYPLVAKLNAPTIRILSRSKTISETSSVNSMTNFALVNQSFRTESSIGWIGSISCVNLDSCSDISRNSGISSNRGRSSGRVFIFECLWPNFSIDIWSLVCKRLDFMHRNIILLLFSWSSCRLSFSCLLHDAISP